MLPNGPLDAIPLWGIFVLTGALILIAVEAGFLLGRRRHRKATEEQAGAVGTMVGSTLGLLAFMLAFVFNFAAGRVDARRVALIDEANAISTTWLRAGIMPEPHRSEIRRLLREDVETQIAGVEVQRTNELMKRVDAIHAELWQHANALGIENPNSEQAALFVEGLNQSVNSYAKRLLAVRTRVAAPVWLILYVLSFLAMFAMGYHVALTGTARSPAIVLVAISFALVICLVADLDRPHEGRMRLSQQPMVDLQTMMSAETR
jgi:hypothetical protein